MGNVKNKRRQTSIMVILTKAVYGIGFGILGLTACVLIFLSIIASKNILTPESLNNIEAVLFFGYFGVVLVLTIAIPFFTARKLRKNGQAILKVIEKIKVQDLDFEISHSEIKEINEILDSMNDMRLVLKESLEKQWSLEQRRKDQIYALAHDFKTPMTVLKGNVDLLQNIITDETNAEYVEDAKYSLDQMEKYLNNLLDMARAEKGYIMNAHKLELYSMVNEIILPLVRIAKEKEVTLSVENEQKTMFICADKLLFQRMINNLVSNALDFTKPKGNIRVRVNASEDNAIISITDSGHGFSQNALKHGLEQFYMDDISRGRENHYGMGLFISDSIVKQHNGRMMLANDEVTRGAKIIISIPLIKE
ncbi:sensor histidine kinase KdpD [Clostridium sp.]|uniref:sensor histidine kinase n=1 Tax=Clostridium sp. TaxID=1506 RepID=UPI002615E443|nr:HAMP domain-containing sensor histidine kinase [Clostridium sp.]